MSMCCESVVSTGAVPFNFDRIIHNSVADRLMADAERIRLSAPADGDFDLSSKKILNEKLAKMYELAEQSARLTQAGVHISSPGVEAVEQTGIREVMVTSLL